MQPSLPIELWSQILSYLSLDERHSLTLLCRVCKALCAIARPLIFSVLQAGDLQHPALYEAFTDNRQAMTLGSMVKRVEVLSEFNLVALEDEASTWLEQEVTMARKKAEMDLKRALLLLDICPNLTACGFFLTEPGAPGMELDDSLQELAYINPLRSDILGCLALRSVTTLSLTRSFGLCTDLQAFGNLLVTLKDLKELKLVTVRPTEIFGPLLQRLSENPGSLSSISHLSYEDMDNEFDESGEAMIPIVNQLGAVVNLGLAGHDLEALALHNTYDVCATVQQLYCRLDQADGAIELEYISVIFPALKRLDLRLGAVDVKHGFNFDEDQISTCIHLEYFSIRLHPSIHPSETDLSKRSSLTLSKFGRFFDRSLFPRLRQCCIVLVGSYRYTYEDVQSACENLLSESTRLAAGMPMKIQLLFGTGHSSTADKIYLHLTKEAHQSTFDISTEECYRSVPTVLNDEEL